MEQSALLRGRGALAAGRESRARAGGSASRSGGGRRLRRGPGPPKRENAFNNYVNRRISGPLFFGVLASRGPPAGAGGARGKAGARPKRERGKAGARPKRERGQSGSAAKAGARQSGSAAKRERRLRSLPEAARAPGTPKPQKQGSRDPSIYIVIKSIFPFLALLAGRGRRRRFWDPGGSEKASKK